MSSKHHLSDDNVIKILDAPRTTRNPKFDDILTFHAVLRMIPTNQRPVNASRPGATRRQWQRPCQALQRRIEALTGLPSGETLSRHLRCCVAWKGRAIPGATRLAANGLASR
ncbi:MAG: hypothetical protein KZQ88_07305 [Candidatus Thiodiazotropha sp. (ex Dulcina madagascariensis)]|nr:hypothetical protein [Candidatus Thiodiazotropha sp. (ex Dulcina madagascariensis)]MCU7925883.1 hypothetical protein [Candidatus Thiodiazotropha sp. (ex Dulcina madagascariensis)]